eukprot:CAMPEP_0174250050 /NCGR_PEP_ID=MMETSP0439-20130205/346_1 /TAXON_ID=0 /ORGANISM="Stereomyxa ramosa, Strain Chinc5" /LENGTH=471 /DNA_ID=CAMNT_0015330023 /DNA_START=70 /DNA_END=1482 /DNA_ORIENTATION=+
MRELKIQENFAVSVKQFYELLLKYPGFTQDFHTFLGERDVTVGEWVDTPQGAKQRMATYSVTIPKEGYLLKRINKGWEYVVKRREILLMEKGRLVLRVKENSVSSVSVEITWELSNVTSGRRNKTKGKSRKRKEKSKVLGSTCVIDVVVSFQGTIFKDTLEQHVTDSTEKRLRTWLELAQRKISSAITDKQKMAFERNQHLFFNGDESAEDYIEEAAESEKEQEIVDKQEEFIDTKTNQSTRAMKVEDSVSDSDSDEDHENSLTDDSSYFSSSSNPTFYDASADWCYNTDEEEHEDLEAEISKMKAHTMGLEGEIRQLRSQIAMAHAHIHQLGFNQYTADTHSGSTNNRSSSFSSESSNPLSLSSPPFSSSKNKLNKDKQFQSPGAHIQHLHQQIEELESKIEDLQLELDLERRTRENTRKELIASTANNEHRIKELEENQMSEYVPQQNQKGMVIKFRYIAGGVLLLLVW